MTDASRGARNHKAEAQASYKAEVNAAKARGKTDRPRRLTSWWAVGAVIVVVLVVGLFVR